MKEGTIRGAHDRSREEENDATVFAEVSERRSVQERGGPLEEFQG